MGSLTAVFGTHFMHGIMSGGLVGRESPQFAGLLHSSPDMGSIDSANDYSNVKLARRLIFNLRAIVPIASLIPLTSGVSKSL